MNIFKIAEEGGAELGNGVKIHPLYKPDPARSIKQGALNIKAREYLESKQLEELENMSLSSYMKLSEKVARFVEEVNNFSPK